MSLRKQMIAVAALASVAGAALAAPPQDARQDRDPQAFAQMRARHAQQRADDIALLLGLTPAQRPALDSLMQAMAPMRPGEHGGWTKPAGAPAAAQPQTFLQKLDRMSQMMDRHDSMAKQRLAAARAFYTSLTPQQQARFDALDRLRHDPMGGPGMHGMHGMRHGPDGDAPPPAG